MNNVEELLTNNTNDMSKLEACKIALQKQLQEIQKLDEQIVELVEEENIEKEIFDRCVFEAAIQEVICRIYSFISGKNIQQENIESVQSEASVLDAEVQGQGQPKQANKTKLPKLVLPRFSGDPTKSTPSGTVSHQRLMRMLI